MWLNAFSDTEATIYTFPACITSADLAGDGDFRLLVADIGSGAIPSKLKIYKGTGLQTQITLDELPCGVAALYIDTERMPVVTVAASEYVYVYKNLKPFFRAVLPALPVNQVERDIWGQYTSVDGLVELLKNLQGESGMASLTLKSQHLLLSAQHERKTYLELHKNTPLARKNVITCMSTLKKSRNDENALTCMVLGTENKEIIVLHPETFTPIEEARLTLADVPVFISTSGLFDIDYTLTTTLRNNHMVLGRRGWVSPLMNLGKPAVGVICLDTQIIVALMDSTLQCYGDKGRRNWRIETPKHITCLEKISLKSRNLDMIGVACENKCLIYSIAGELLDTIEFDESLSAMYFGQYGRETNSLAVITSGGSLHVKILKRNAEFVPQYDKSLVPVVSKLQIPKKTKLFVDQTMRERENSIAMHRIFQKHVFQAKLETARQLVHVINTKQTPTTFNDSVKLSAQVLGLGPSFRIQIGVCNISASPLCGIALFFHWDDKFYKIKPPFIHVPMLVPSVELKFITKVECVTESGIADIVRVVVIQNSQPILVAIINMPASEMTLLD